MDSPATPVAMSDEFTNYISGVIAGFLNPGSLYLFDLAAAQLPSDDPVLEIGSCAGLSLNMIAYFMRKHGRTNTKIFSCDPWMFPAENIAGSNVSKLGYREFLIDTVKRSVRFFSRENLPYTIECTSGDFFQKWEKGDYATDLFKRNVRLGDKLSFCYIDGWHSYEAVREDFTNCDRFLVKGGLILFDDSGDEMTWFAGVQQAVKEVLDSGRYEVVAKNPNYLVRKLA